MECHSTNVCCHILKSRNDPLGKCVQHAQFKIVESIWWIYSIWQDHVPRKICSPWGLRLKSWEDVTFEIYELGIRRFFEAGRIIRSTSRTVSYAKELTSVYICYTQGNGFSTPLCGLLCTVHGESVRCSFRYGASRTNLPRAPVINIDVPL